MNPKETGIVRLEDLPLKEIYIYLKEDFFDTLNNKIRDFGIYKFSMKIDVSERILCHWLSEGHLIRLDVLYKICDYFGLELHEQIDYIRGKDGGKIKNPKLPFNFTSEEGVRVIAGILGDGGIPQRRKNPYYTNSNKDLINGFLKDINFVIGDVGHSSREKIDKTSTTTILEFPILIYKILYAIGLKSGKKVESNQNLLSFIFKLNNKKKFAFISQFIDDEGTVNLASRHITLTSACLEKYPKQNMLEDIKNLLLSLDIYCSIYQDRIYTSTRGTNRRIWKLQINGQIQLKVLYRNLTMRNRDKLKKLKFILNSFSQEHYSKNRCKSIYISKMQKIEKEKGFFTSDDLTILLKRKVGHIRNMLFKYNKEGVITKIENASLDSFGSYPAKYVIKNE